MTESVALRREPAEGERLVRCKLCGKVEVPLNTAETWHYVRTGEGLGTDCPKSRGPNWWHEWRVLDTDPSPA